MEQGLIFPISIPDFSYFVTSNVFNISILHPNANR
jgi:hypothetical protein